MKPASALRIAAAGAFFLAQAAAQQPPRINPFANNPQEAGVGKGIFRIRCAPCHGIRAKGGRGPDLTRGTYASGDTDADLFRTIAEGVPGTEMGAYGGGNQSDENLWRLVAYIRSTTTVDASPPARGDAAAGEQLFWGKGNCGACHAVGPKGGHSAPNLTRIGRQRSTSYLRESIVDPGKDIAPGYTTLTVVTKDGRKITGIERGLDNFTAQLTDLNGNFHSFDKADLRSITEETRSLMPATYGRDFTAAELDNLIAYLLSLRGGSQ